MPRKKCPKCGSTNLAKYLYGLPSMAKILEASSENKEILLGGCLLDIDSPKYHCNECKKDIIYDYTFRFPLITKFTFEIGSYFEGHEQYTVESGTEEYRITYSGNADGVFTEKTITITEEQYLDIMERLCECYIFEWKHNYSKPSVEDGTTWEISIKEIGSSRKKVWKGHEDYPPYWKHFLKVIEIVKSIYYRE